MGELLMAHYAMSGDYATAWEWLTLFKEQRLVDQDLTDFERAIKQ